MQKTILLSGVLLAAFMVTSASAQMVNYATLEGLFGEPVTTSVTGKPQRASEAPASLIIVSGEQFRRSGATNIAELLQTYAGIDVLRSTPGQYDLSVRGGGGAMSPTMLVMVNGRQVYMDHYGMTNWLALGVEPAEIQQIEVVKGPNTALFGFNAVNGVVNIITKNPLQDRVQFAEASIGNHGERLFSAIASLKPSSRIGLRVSGGYESFSSNVDYLPNPILPVMGQPDEDVRRKNVAVDALADLTSNVRLRLNYTYTQSNRFEETPFYYPIDSHYKTHGGQAQLTADTSLGLIELSSYVNSLRHSIEYESFKNLITATKLQDLLKIGSNDTIRLSLEYRYNEMTIITPDYGEVSGTVFYNVFSGATMWEHNFSDRLTMTNALRIDRLDLGHRGAFPALAPFTTSSFNRSITEWSMNSALSWRVGDLTRLRLSGGRGVGLPSLINLSLVTIINQNGFPVLGIYGNPSLSPTIATSYELGIDQRIPALKAELNAAVFYANNKDIVVDLAHNGVLMAGPVMLPYLDAANQGNLARYGLEASLHGRINTNWSWRLDYTYTRQDQNLGVSGSPRIPNIAFDWVTPRHKIGGGVDYDNGPFSVSTNFIFRSKVKHPTAMLDPLQGIFAQPRNAAVGLNGKVAYKPIEHLEIYVAASNLTGSKYINNGDAQDLIRVRVGAAVSF